MAPYSQDNSGPKGWRVMVTISWTEETKARVDQGCVECSSFKRDLRVSERELGKTDLFDAHEIKRSPLWSNRFQ